MAVAFMAFLAILIGEQVAPRIGARALMPLLVLGVLSVAYWWFTDQRGRDDLRPYFLVQFLPLALAPLILLLFPSPFPRRSLLWGSLGAYALAKVFELFDEPIFQAIGVARGHSLKHLAAALGASLIVLAATRRAIQRANRAGVPTVLVADSLSPVLRIRRARAARAPDREFSEETQEIPGSFQRLPPRESAIVRIAQDTGGRYETRKSGSVPSPPRSLLRAFLRRPADD